MSMVEYMCKLFYGRRGIQLTEEQFEAVVGRSPNGSQLRNIFSDLNNNNNEDENENEMDVESSKYNDWMIRSLSAFGSDDWTKPTSQCTNLHKNYFSPLQFSAFSFSFPQSSGTFSSNKYFSPDTIPHDYHATNAQTSSSSLSISHYIPNSQEFLTSSFNEHQPEYGPSDPINHSINNLRLTQPFSSQNTSYLNIGEIEQSPTFSTEQQDMQLASVFRSSSDEQDISNPPISVHFTLSPSSKNDFMVIPPEVSTLSNHRFYKTEYFNNRYDKEYCETKSQMFEESSYHKIPCKMLNVDQQVSEDRKSLAHLYRYQVMSPTVDSTVNSVDQSFSCGNNNNNNNNNYYQPCSFDISYDTDYYKFQGYGKNFADNTDMMVNVRSLQHVCAVCGDHAACQHYGVRTCEGCKGFFKRTVQKSAVYVCLSGKNCPIDKRRRNRCQYCRFEKCLAVGMVKEVVRTDLLKGRRGRLPSKPKPPLREYSASPPISFITAVVRAHVDTSPDMQNHDYLHYLKPLARHIDSIDVDDSVHLLANILEHTIQILTDWSSRLPGFNLLANHDQQILFHSNIIDIVILRIAFRIERDDNKLIFCNGVVLDWMNYKHFPAFSWLEIVREFVLTVTNIDGDVMDLSTMSCMVALCLLAYREGLQDPVAVEKLQTSLVDALSKHQSMNLKKRTYLPCVLAKLTELKSYSQRVLEHLNLLGATQPYNSVINKILFSIRHFESITWNI